METIELEATIDVLNTIRRESCCDDVRDEHLMMMFEDFFEEYELNVSIRHPLEGFTVLRKWILEHPHMDSAGKVHLIKKIHNM